MKVTYNSPNRSHHYPYAEALHRAGALRCFVSGYSRWGRDPSPEHLRDKIKRVDLLQTLYVLALRKNLGPAIAERLAWWSKQRLDRASYAAARQSDIFLFYSGAGLHSTRRLKAEGASTLCVVEAVNTHARHQERLLREEHERLGMPFRRFPPSELAARCAEYQEADAILCPSRAVKRSFVEEGIAADKIIVVPYGFPSPAARPPALQEDPQPFNVLYVGSLSVRKGIRYLIEAFRAVRHSRKRLILVGPRSPQSGFEDLAPGEDIEFAGVLKGEALRAAYTSASVFVQPSLEEGLSLVLGEALGAGLPIVATRESGVEELFEDGECGYYVPIRSPAAITARLQMLADDVALRNRLRAAAGERAKALGGWEQSGRNLVEALRGFR